MMAARLELGDLCPDLVYQPTGGAYHPAIEREQHGVVRQPGGLAAQPKPNADDSPALDFS
jgi:hypothetical protein